MKKNHNVGREKEKMGAYYSNMSYFVYSNTNYFVYEVNCQILK